MKGPFLSRAALIAVDMQRYFLRRGAPAFLSPPRRLVPNALRLVEAFRGAGLPVIFTRHAHRRGSETGEMGRFWRGHLPWDGTRHAELIPEIEPLPDEPVITKVRYSAFEGTGLEAFLRKLGVREVVLCGVMTNLCVETSARHAFMKDFEVTIAQDACAANTPRHHAASLLNLSYGFARLETSRSIASALRDIMARRPSGSRGDDEG
jgi:nicotinamidase-related amidase